MSEQKISYEQELRNKAHKRRKEYESVLESIAAMIKDSPELSVSRLLEEAFDFYFETMWNEDGTEKASHEAYVSDNQLSEILRRFWRSKEWEELVSQLQQ